MTRLLSSLRRGRNARDPVSPKDRGGPGPSVSAPEADLRRLHSDLNRLAKVTTDEADAVSLLAARFHDAAPAERHRLRRDLLALAAGFQDVAARLRAERKDTAQRRSRLGHHAAASRAYVAAATSSKR